MPIKSMGMDYIHRSIIIPAMELLPSRYNVPAARAELLAIGMQETKFTQRQQLIGNKRNWWESPNGPATSFWSFELPTIQLVLDHRTTGPLLMVVLATLGYPNDAKLIHHAIIHNDLLAACMARLLLLTYPGPLPKQDDHQEGWKQYLWAWRPGKPRPLNWVEYYANAWDIEVAQ